jgi:hypothetical protein
MNVAELIEKLKEMPQDLPVYTHDSDYGFEDPDPYVTEKTKVISYGDIKKETIVRL